MDFSPRKMEACRNCSKKDSYVGLGPARQGACPPLVAGALECGSVPRPLAPDHALYAPRS